MAPSTPPPTTPAFSVGTRSQTGGSSSAARTCTRRITSPPPPTAGLRIRPPFHHSSPHGNAALFGGGNHLRGHRASPDKLFRRKKKGGAPPPSMWHIKMCSPRYRYNPSACYRGPCFTSGALRLRRRHSSCNLSSSAGMCGHKTRRRRLRTLGVKPAPGQEIQSMCTRCCHAILSTSVGARW